MKEKSLSKRNIIINLAIILLVTGLVVFYMLKSKMLTAETIRNTSWYNYLVVGAVFFFSLGLISLVDFFVYRSFTKSMPYNKCYISTICGNLGSGVTPFKSGHFPLMIYYQNRAKVPVGDTVTGLIKCQIIYSATSIVVYTAVVLTLGIMGTSIDFYGSTVKLWLVVSLGLFFHLIVFVVIVILAFNRKIQLTALKLWSKVLIKIKKLQDTEQYILQKTERLNIYKEQITIIGKNAHKYLAPCLIYVCHMFISGTIQYIAYLMVSGSAFNFSSLFTFYTFYLASGYITNVIPVPGGLGTSELLFPLVFASIIPDKLIGSVLILWRLSTYYFAIIVEFIVFLFAVLIKRKPKAQLEQQAETTDLQ